MSWTVRLEGGPRRVNQAAVAIGDRIYSFGGYCRHENENYIGSRPMDVYVLNTISLRWTALSIPDPNDPQYKHIPFLRYGHTAVIFRKKALIWGGKNKICVDSNLYSFDVAKHKWMKHRVSGRVPAPTYNHSACIINCYMYIFGGTGNNNHRYVHRLNCKTRAWSLILTNGIPPRCRHLHTVTALGHHMYIFGGVGDRLGPYLFPDERYCDQITYLDTKTRTWCQPNTTGLTPIGRRSHVAFVYKDQLYIFGGRNHLHNVYFCDLLRYDPASCVWSIVKVQNAGPGPTVRPSCCLIKDRLFLFGGRGPYPEGQNQPFKRSSLIVRNDLHVLDFAPSLQTLCSMVVIKHSLDQTGLPVDIRSEIASMTTNSNISGPLKKAG